MPQIIRIGGQQAAPPSGLADGLGKLGDALFGGNQAQQALLREKATEAQRLNAGNLAFQEGLRGSADLPPEELAARAQAAGVSGKGLGEFGRTIAASRYGAADPRTSAQQIAAGQGLGDTFVGAKLTDDTTRRGQDVTAATQIATNAATNATTRRGQDLTVGEQRRQFDEAPTNVLGDTGQSTIVRRSESYGRNAPEQLNVVQGNAARNALTAGSGQIPETTNQPTREFIGAATKGETTPEIIRLQSARDAMPAADPRRRELDRAIAAKAVSAGGEGVYDKTTSEDFAKTDVGIQNDARTSTQREAMLGNMENLIRTGRVSTGAGSQYVLAAKQLAAQLGVPMEGVSETEVFRALANKLTLDAAGGSLGAQISDSDRRFLQEAAPGMAIGAQGNLKLIDTLKKLEQRKREVAGWLSDYKRQNGGRVDAGWSAFAQERAEASPLFGRPGPAAGAPAASRGSDFKILGVR